MEKNEKITFGDITVEDGVLVKARQADTLHIPGCVTAIAPTAFDGLRGPITVVFEGTLRQWSRIAQTYPDIRTGPVVYVKCRDDSVIYHL